MAFYGIIALIFLVVILPFVLLNKNLRKKDKLDVRIISAILISLFWPLSIVIITVLLIKSFIR